MKVFVLLSAILVAAAAGENGTDLLANQLLIYKENHVPPYVLTTRSGAPVTCAHATSTLNTNLINNDHFWNMMGQLVRGNIPERAGHPQGSGAFGYAVVLKDISHICKADFLNEVGKKTPIVIRFSTTGGSIGSPDLALAVYGFAIKFYTREGNFDLAGLHTPVFSAKEPLHGHNIIRTGRRHPRTNTIDRNMPWDRIVHIPEALHALMLANIGVPASYSNMPGFSIHTYQVENEHGDHSFCRFHILPDAGIKNMPAEEARKIAASEPDYLTKDLYHRIANGSYPTWTLYFQCLSKAEVKKEGSRVFDLTRRLPEDKFPLIEVARLVLDGIPNNHVAEIEHSAFCPCHLVPGIDGAPDKTFEARRMIYRDAQHYRLGANYLNIPVNCPFQTKTHTYDRDGLPPANVDDGPNYYPNSFNGPECYEPKYRSSLIQIKEKEGADNIDQMRDLFTEGLTDEQRTEMIKNLAASLKPVSSCLKEKVLQLMYEIHEDFRARMEEEMNATS